MFKPLLMRQTLFDFDVLLFLEPFNGNPSQTCHLPGKDPGGTLGVTVAAFVSRLGGCGSCEISPQPHRRSLSGCRNTQT